MVQTNNPNRQMHANQQIAIVLIINNLSLKKHENTGNKPAKPEMSNKQNMTHTHQQINLHYQSQNNQIDHGSDKQPLPANACKPAKVNSIDNQRVIPQNT